MGGGVQRLDVSNPFHFALGDIIIQHTGQPIRFKQGSGTLPLPPCIILHSLTPHPLKKKSGSVDHQTDLI